MKYTNKNVGYYANSRPEMQALLPANAKTVLDVGCGSGTMAMEIKERLNLEVWGIEPMRNETELARQKLDQVLNLKIEEAIEELPEAYFDAIYFNDILEHLADPQHVIEIVKPKLTPDGVIISSIPNVRYHRVMWDYLVKKDWRYQKSGVMDFTHLRFFTSKSIKRMYTNAGYEILRHQGINRTKSIKPYLYSLPLLFTAPDMFYLQYGTVARKASL